MNKQTGARLLPLLLRRLCVVGILMLAGRTLCGAEPDSAAAVSKYLRDMQGNDHDTRLKAAVALSKMDCSILPKLLPLLKHDDDEVRQYTVVAIGGMGIKAEEAIPQLTEMLKDVEDEVRYSAADALAEMGSAAAPAIDPLLKLFDDPDISARQSAAEALGAIGPEARPKLLAILKDPRSSNSHREYACMALGCLRPVDEDTVTEVSRQLRNKDEDVRLEALESLAVMGSAASNAVPYLVALYRRDVKLRWAISNCIGRIEPDSPEAVKAIHLSLKDEDATVRLFGLVAFSRLTLPVKERLAVYRRLTKDSNALVRQMVVRELRDLQERAYPALAELKALQKDSDADVRQVATRTVKALTLTEDDIE